MGISTLPYMAEPSYLYCGGQGDTPFQSACGCPYEKKPDYKLKHISRAELQRIMEQPMPERLQELTRRAFIFSAFTGLSYVDVKRLYPSHIGTTADGRKYIRINRKKTDVESFIPLHPVAEQILSLYNTTDDSRPIFPLPSVTCYGTAYTKSG